MVHKSIFIRHSIELKYIKKWHFQVFFTDLKTTTAKTLMTESIEKIRKSRRWHTWLVSTSCGSHGACFPEGQRASAKPAHYLGRVRLRESPCCLQGRECKSRTNWKRHSHVIEEAIGRREGESRWHHGDITVTSGTGETSRELCVTEKRRFHTSGQFTSQSALRICVLWAAPCWHRGECLPLRKYGEMSTWPWNKEPRLQFCSRHRWAARDLSGSFTLTVTMNSGSSENGHGHHGRCLTQNSLSEAARPVRVSFFASCLLSLGYSMKRPNTEKDFLTFFLQRVNCWVLFIFFLTRATNWQISLRRMGSVLLHSPGYMLCDLLIDFIDFISHYFGHSSQFRCSFAAYHFSSLGKPLDLCSVAWERFDSLLEDRFL